MFYALDVCASRARSCFSRAASSASGRNGTTTRASTGTCSQYPEHDGLQRLVQHLNHLYKTEPALSDLDDTYEGFEWIDFHDADNSVLAFMRKSRQRRRRSSSSSTPRRSCARTTASGVRGEGCYEEILNTDAETYGGSNVGNYGSVWAEPVAWQGKSHSLVLRIPPLAVVGFKKT